MGEGRAAFSMDLAMLAQLRSLVLVRATAYYTINY